MVIKQKYKKLVTFSKTFKIHVIPMTMNVSIFRYIIENCSLNHNI